MLLKFAFLATIVAAALADHPEITCHKGGAHHAHDCAHFIKDFCDDIAKHPVRADDSISHCFNLHNGHRCDFTALNTRKYDGPPYFHVCQAALEEITKKCKAGGWGRLGHDTFTFSVEPNFGHCNPKV